MAVTGRNVIQSLSCLLKYFIAIFQGLKKDKHIFLIFALGNDIQLTLAAIFNVIVFKRCVKFFGS